MEIKSHRLCSVYQRLHLRLLVWFICFVMALLFSSVSVKAQYEGFPLSASPCPVIGSGYGTYLYLGTGVGEEGYDYHWYKGTDYTGTYLGSTNVSTGGIGADMEIVTMVDAKYV